MKSKSWKYEMSDGTRVKDEMLADSMRVCPKTAVKSREEVLAAKKYRVRRFS